MIHTVVAGVSWEAEAQQIRCEKSDFRLVRGFANRGAGDDIVWQICQRLSMVCADAGYDAVPARWSFSSQSKWSYE